jgi:peptidoglycan/LPS O-acetylase OafA/YrhL
MSIESRPMQTGQHYEWLDFLRFMAALIVVATHTRGAVFLEWSALTPNSQNPITGMFFAATRLGEEAVIIFFVISGYLVGGRSFERIIQKQFVPVDYAIDRITRIWIPLVPALVISALLSEQFESPAVWFGNLIGLQGALVPSLGGNAPLWSLAYEIWFYVLVYALGRQVESNKLDFVSILLLMAVAIVFCRLSFHYLFCWLLGAYCYVKPPSISVKSTLIIAVLVCLAAIAGSQARGPLAIGVDHVRGLKELLDLVLAFGAALLCSALVKVPISRQRRWFTYLAGFSYTLYLVHAPLLLYVARKYITRRSTVDIVGLLLYGALLLSFIVISWVLYLIFERNTSTVRQWIKIKLDQIRPTTKPAGQSL